MTVLAKFAGARVIFGATDSAPLPPPQKFRGCTIRQTVDHTPLARYQIIACVISSRSLARPPRFVILLSNKRRRGERDASRKETVSSSLFLTRRTERTGSRARYMRARGTKINQPVPGFFALAQLRGLGIKGSKSQLPWPSPASSVSRHNLYALFCWY